MDRLVGGKIMRNALAKRLEELELRREMLQDSVVENRKLDHLDKLIDEFRAQIAVYDNQLNNE